MSMAKEESFKSVPVNNEEIGFKTVESTDMNLEMKPAKVEMSDVYTSPSVKERQDFPWFNHTGIMVSFNKKALETKTSKELAQEVKKIWGNKETGLTGGFKLSKVYAKHVEFDLGNIKELKKAAEMLYESENVLCAEYLMRQKVFGKYADLGEMASYKSRVQRREPPKESEEELEAKRKEERERREAEQKKKDEEKEAKKQREKERREKIEARKAEILARKQAGEELT